MSVAESEPRVQKDFGLKHMWSLPNQLTCARVVMVVAMVPCFYLETPWSHWLTFGLFVAASITDALDGFLARRWNQESVIGRILDPIADKTLVIAALCMMLGETISGPHKIAVLIIIFREVIVDGLRLLLAKLGKDLLVTPLAKAKVHFQAWAIALLLISPVADAWFDRPVLGVGAVTFPGLFLLWAAMVITFITGCGYCYAAGCAVAQHSE